MTLAVRGRVLPDGDERTLFIDGDRITFEPVPGAELVHEGGWLVPGLVDVHTHPGAHHPGDPLDDRLLVEDLSSHVASGVAAVRTPGIAGGVVPAWVMSDPDLPRVAPGGHWLAARDGFFAGWGRQLDPEELPAAAVEEAERWGWCKVIVDWVVDAATGRRYEPTVPPDIVMEIVRCVHDAGGRVAVHSQHPDGAEAAVVAGADSLEHGMHLRDDLLDRMAAQSTVLVPTMVAFESIPARVAELDEPTWMSRFMEQGWRRHPALVAAAHEAGVTVLAGTDSIPHGNIAREAALLAAAGLPPIAALAAASWSARAFLGLAGLDEGAPADVVGFDANITVDADALASPALVITKGRVRLAAP